MEAARPVRGWRRPVGWVLVTAGLVMLGYAAWQFVGTNVVAQREHGRITASVEEAWAAGDAAVRVDGADSSASALIRVPRFGDDFVVPVLEGVGDEALASGFGHVPGTADPGEVGNFAVAGHRVTHGEPLRDMPELRVGDEVIVETRTQVHTYVLDTPGAALEVPFTAGWVLSPLPDNPDGDLEPEQRAGQRLITLVTCSELFHTDDRLVAFGHLVESESR